MVHFVLECEKKIICIRITAVPAYYPLHTKLFSENVILHGRNEITQTEK